MKQSMKVSKDIFQRIYCEDAHKLGRRIHWLSTWSHNEKMHRYNGPADLITWFDVQNRPLPHYQPHDQVEELAALNALRNRQILHQHCGLDPAQYAYHNVDTYNAVDYLFQHAYPVPDRMKPRAVLDFGAGYGRQINLWSQLSEDIIYTAMDGVERPYCLQSLYFSGFDCPCREYMIDCDEFRIEKKPGIYHVPTWRYDLLPDAFYDMVLCVQVLPEISKKLLLHMLDVFARVVKPCGAIYIRDHRKRFSPGNSVDIDRILEKKCFKLEWEPCVEDSHRTQMTHGDVHGIPRIWRKLEI